MAECIPFGQPIIVGHHSEKRDRAFRNKIANNFDKGFEALDKAKYYEHKAQAAENNTAISSDDPEAIKLLKEKLEKLINNQEFMKTVNKIVNSKRKPTKKKYKKLSSLEYLNKQQKSIRARLLRSYWFSGLCFTE